MQIHTDEATTGILNLSPADSIRLELEQDLEALAQEILWVTKIQSVTEFVVEYISVLTTIAELITTLYSDMEKVTDPSILNSPGYQNMMEDLTKSTNPSLLAGANEVYKDPKVLALTLLEMKGTELEHFQADINLFLHDLEYGQN